MKMTPVDAPMHQALTRPKPTGLTRLGVRESYPWGWFRSSPTNGRRGARLRPDSPSQKMVWKQRYLPLPRSFDVDP
jgi:hypothetical protein